MTIQSRVTGTISLDSTYGDWKTHTVEVNFAPKTSQASVTVCQLYGDSLGALGIRSFEFRDSPTGPNKKKDFGSLFWEWPPSVDHALMTRVTFGVSVLYSICSGSWTIDFWS
jgi:hypothetical protein